MKLTRKIINLSSQHPTPFLLFDLDKIRDNYRKIKGSFKDIEVFYAIKANDHPKIINTLAREGSSFEISSLVELRLLIGLKIPPERIICLNPIKSPEFLIELVKHRVNLMAVDSFDEVDKIAKFAPKSKVVMRINVSNEGSDWPLTKKFGIDAADALPLLKYSKKEGIDPIGLTFHVGSQCLNKNNWAGALYICDDIWNQAMQNDIHFTFLSLGGGIPIKHLKKSPTVGQIGKVVNNVISRNFKSDSGTVRLTIEPGRGLVGDAAIMVTKVVGRAKRGNEDWVYIDSGVFNGFMETICDFTYEVRTAKTGERKPVTIAGPSCDSVDVPFKNTQLADVDVGDYIYIINAGAYTTVYASTFNGFEIPKTYFL